MARGIKHIKAGLLHVEVIGAIPERESGRRRAGRCRPTSAAQQFYNDKCSWRECALWLSSNFGMRDYLYTLTYDDTHLPVNREGARKAFQKFVKKLRAVRKKRGEDLLYLYVTEGWHGKTSEGDFDGDGQLEDRRFHHHALFNSVGPGDLEEICSLWETIGGGYVRSEPVNIHYYRELAKYLTKEPREFGRAKPGDRSWGKSQNLKKYQVEYEEVRSDSVTLTAPPGAVDYVQFTTKNPFGFSDCIVAWYLLFENEPPPDYSYIKGRKRSRTNNF